MIKEDLQKLFQECLAEISALGISLPDNLLLKRIERMPEPVYIGFYDDRTEMTLAEALLKLPVAMVKAEIIGQILSITNSKQQYGQEWLTKAAKVQVACGYDMLNELDKYNLSRQPLKGQLICAKCGSHYDMRGAKCYRVWLDNGEIDKICQHCGGNMWPEPEAAAPGEPDLQALLAECLEKIHALGIKTGKIACIRWKKHTTGFYGCCGEQNDEFEIQISELYRRGEENVERLRDTIFHEILHTCDRCGNHDQEFWDYARRLDEAYGTHVFFAEPGHDGSPRPKRQEKNISIMLEECVHKLRQIGIEPGNILRIEWIFEYVELGRCQKTEVGFVIQIADRCQKMCRLPTPICRILLRTSCCIPAQAAMLTLYDLETPLRPSPVMEPEDFAYDFAAPADLGYDRPILHKQKREGWLAMSG